GGGRRAAGARRQARRARGASRRAAARQPAAPQAAGARTPVRRAAAAVHREWLRLRWQRLERPLSGALEPTQGGRTPPPTERPAARRPLSNATGSAGSPEAGRDTRWTGSLSAAVVRSKATS